jgi:hypothetical protein
MSTILQAEADPGKAATDSALPASVQPAEISIRGDRLPLSPQAIQAAAKLLLAVVRQRKKQRQAQQAAGDQAGDGTTPRETDQ